MSETFDPGQTLTAAELNAAFADVTPPSAPLLGGTGTVFVVISVGSGLAINSHTLEATGGAGTVTEVVAGAGLNGGTIISSGTFTANYQAGTLTTIGAGLSINSDTLVAQWQAGLVNTLGPGVAINSGTVETDGQAILNGGSHFTITPSNGVSNVLINGNTAAATTIDIGPPAYQGQHLRVQYKNGTTTQALDLGTSIVFGSTITSYTSTPSAGESDFLQFIGANGSQWAVVGLAQGFTI